MKQVRCAKCHRTDEVENNVVIAICPACQISMEIEEAEDGDRRD